MFRNYLKIALRNFWKYKFNTLVNLLGLTVGVAGCLLIGLYVWDEWQYDRFVPDADRIFRVYDERIAEDGSGLLALTPPVFAATMKADFPEVEQTLRLLNVYNDQLFVLGGQRHMEGGGIYGEPAIFDFFDLKLTAGDPAAALLEPNNVVLSAPLAKKYFGDINPTGKTIEINDREVTVTGVLADLPDNFHLDFNYVLSFITVERIVPEERMNSWIWQQFFTYLKLSENADAGALEAKLPAFAERHAWPKTEPRGFKYRPHLQNLTDIHLHSSSFGWDIARRGNITTVRTLTAVGLFLLLIAIINFVNLSTARAENRAREVGVRKVSGAQRGQLITQFISEAVVLSMLAVFLAGQLTKLLLPALNTFTGKVLVFEPLSEPALLLLLIGTGGIVGVLAGSYPGFVLSSFRPIQVIRQQPLDDARHGQWLRKGLVVLQFALTVILLIGSLVIYQQIRYLSHKDLGFQRAHLLTFPMRDDMRAHYETVKEAFTQNPNVEMATATYGIPGDIVAGDDIIVPGKEGSQPANVFTVDHDYIETLGLEVVAGRGFSRDYATDAGEAFVINETAVRELGLGTPQEAVGQPLQWEMWGQDSVKKGKIIGVVRDFHYNSLHEKIGTAVLHIYPQSFWKIVLRLRGKDLAGTIDFIKKTWARFDTGYPLEYQFVDESFGAMYTSETKLSQLLILFTALTIFVACLGLLGLAIFAAEKRTKEIGIRKILGASPLNIMALLASDFLRLIVVAVIIAAPVGWYFSRQWLENFSYHVAVQPWVFLLAGGLALLIALVTVSFHSMRAAVRNPVDALRYE